MLKALELVGFKSFADKTRLEFPSGITVVVGPNGSGKSNIVDAIKWVLGEQSVKSLRGKEMADVIFNGSASRRPQNSAEVTLVFDNANRIFDIEAPEVQIGRRVYRSGEGEYLVNRQPCRLRDIRDLIAGTGLGAEAYSVIEQGKVDVLLQSSPRDRRLIFEEAAGISRFKSKRLESQRRLERVEQNLLRLTDIVDEVESRLRSVRQQAAKAQRYKEHADRLQLLRTALALVDWRRLSAELAEIETGAEAARDELRAAAAQGESCQAQILTLEQETSRLEELLRTAHLRIAENRERIASCESAIEHQRRRLQDLEDEVGLHRRQLSSIAARADDLEDQQRANQHSLTEVDRQQQNAAAALAEQERSLNRLTAELERARLDHEATRAGHLEKLRDAAALDSRISALDAQAEAADAAHEQGRRRLTELETALAAATAEHAELSPQFAALAEQAAQERTAAQAVETRLGALRVEHARTQNDLATVRERASRASERYAVLEELERRQEGLQSGVKEVLRQARSATPGAMAEVAGLVADLLQVHIDRAPAIEAALGEMAQHIVIGASGPLLEHLQSEEARFSGRVTFLRSDAPPAPVVDPAVYAGEAGVLGRADRFVETAPEHAVLARRLLGRTWLVDTLARAIALAEGAERGVAFVTERGELVTADGTIAVGARGGASGLISRRSELRALRQQIADLSAQTTARRERLEALERNLAEFGVELANRNARVATVERELGDVKLRVLAAEQRVVRLDEDQRSLVAEVEGAERSLAQARGTLIEARAQRQQTETIVAELEARMRDVAALAAQLEQSRSRASRDASATRIDLARLEQQREDLQRRAAQIERDRQERGRSLAENRSQLELALRRARDTERQILATESEVALLYLSKEALAGETSGSVARRQEIRERRAALAAEDQRLRAKTRKLESKLHAQEMLSGETRHARATIEERMREDYALDLATCEGSPVELDVERPEAEAEIATLRSKLNSIGSVNLEALDELEQLETRYQTLAAQHQDLSSAKASLEQIINKINADSRRLFGDTLEVVRGYFQALFRKLFGGGQADILLDEGVDILESGIEIVARPPGKEPRSISLLSGGEKTLTCVALLMAIFRSRPSPFCVLDEVDAALDEANIERFVGVLREFLAWTQFVVVTHSKKTMTCAGAIYGITMQESGVSKRVSVRFDDVSDNGEFVVRPEDSMAGESSTSEDETQAA